MPLLIGASAIGLDTMQLTLAKRTLQRSADSAAIAGAYARWRSDPVAGAVERDLSLNNKIVLSGSAIIQNAPEVGAYAGDQNAVRVALSASRAVPFISFFTGSDISVSVEATAAALPDGKYCVVSLEQTAATGVTFDGNADINLGCGVASNSTGDNAIAFSGGPLVTASPITAVGGVPPASAFQGDTLVRPYGIRQPDPFATLADPVLPSPCSLAVTVEPNQTRTLSPGCYRGMTLKGTVNLSPGVYYIDSGDLLIESQAIVSGTGVTFVLTSSNAVSNPSSVGNLAIAGGATLNLTAPTSGEYAGILLYQDRRANLATNYLRGSSSSVVEGAFYMPAQHLVVEGSAGMDMKCLRLVARQATFAGNGGLSNDCPSDRSFRDFDGIAIKVVE